MKRAMVFFLTGLGLVGCVFIKGKDEKLTLEKKDYQGNKIRLNGFYYLDDSIGSNVSVYFLYRNGVVFDAGAFGHEALDTVDKVLNSKEYLQGYKKVKWMWGIYNIEQDSISFEKLDPSGNYIAGIRSGKILNDTTFVILQYRRSDGSERSKVENQVYRFKKYFPKPDSTNEVIGN